MFVHLNPEWNEAIYGRGRATKVSLKEMRWNEEPITGGKPTYIGLPPRHMSPDHHVPDTNHVPLCGNAMLCDIAGLLCELIIQREHTMLCEIATLCERLSLSLTVATGIGTYPGS